MEDVQDQCAWDSGNPLLAKLPIERSFVEWGGRLGYDPRRSWKMPFGTRLESHVRLIKRLIVPTERAIALAVSLQTMLIDSLRRRDPRLVANRRRLFHLQELKGIDLGDELERMPWSADGAEGAIEQGPTGCSKTHSYEAFCRHMPQVVEHGPNEECGWLSLKQLVWLRVYMPADANRRSLYLAIAREVDVVLGTSYALRLTDRMKNGPMLLEVIHILTIHRCGLLILDEAQVRNLGPMILGNEFVVTFLRIMNCGVPMVLVGNPLSFENVLNFSQDLRRYTDGGIFDFAPVYDESDDEWREDLVPSIWSWTIFDRPDMSMRSVDLPHLLYQRTGGVHDFLARYRRECLLNALRRGASRVEFQDLDAAYFSRSYRGLHRLIDAYVAKDIDKLRVFEDQPIVFLQELWAEERDERQACPATRRPVRIGRVRDSAKSAT